MCRSIGRQLRSRLTRAIAGDRNALAEAAAQHGQAVRWLRLDIDSADTAPLQPDGYDLITLRLVYPFLTTRDQTLRALGRRLRTGGHHHARLRHPAEFLGAALEEAELAHLQAGWPVAERHDTEGLAVVLCSGAAESTRSADPAGVRAPSRRLQRRGFLPNP
jgi:hypothetical protein